MWLFEYVHAWGAVLCLNIFTASLAVLFGVVSARLQVKATDTPYNLDRSLVSLIILSPAAPCLFFFLLILSDATLSHWSADQSIGTFAFRSMLGAFLMAFPASFASFFSSFFAWAWKSRWPDLRPRQSGAAIAVLVTAAICLIPSSAAEYWWFIQDSVY